MYCASVTLKKRRYLLKGVKHNNLLLLYNNKFSLTTPMRQTAH